MSRAAQHKRKKSQPKIKERRASDRSIYFGLTLIGIFVVLLAIPLTGGQLWQELLVGYLLAIAWLVNLYTFRAWRGQALGTFQAALARLPLRCVGYGTKGGKPVEAAAKQDNAKLMLMVSIAASIVIIAVASVLLIDVS